MLTQVQKANFERDGYLVLEEVIPLSLIHAMHE